MSEKRNKEKRHRKGDSSGKKKTKTNRTRIKR
jgi:hypothetical protein